MDSEGKLPWDFPVRQPAMQEGGFGFWAGDWDGYGLDEVLVNDRQAVNVVDGYGKVIERMAGHLVYVFHLIGDSRPEAIVLTGIKPGMRLDW